MTSSETTHARHRPPDTHVDPDLRRPSRLRPGDQITVVAPAGPVPEPKLTAGVRVLESWGLTVRVGAHVLDRHPEFDYLAGQDADRATDFQQAWLEPANAAVWCARGGYGSLRMLDHLDWAALERAQPRLLIGSSDITALHNVVANRLGLVTLFAPMLATDAFLTDEPARLHLRQTLLEPASTCRLAGPDAEPLVAGSARGRLVGGNLSLLASGVGVADVAPPRDGAIALLEDIGEDPYRIDHFVTHLLRAGWFDQVSGIALGSWEGCGPLDTVRAVLSDRLGGLGVPVIWELGFGHGPGALTMPLGMTADLVADPATGQASITLTAPALA